MDARIGNAGMHLLERFAEEHATEFRDFAQKHLQKALTEAGNDPTARVMRLVADTRPPPPTETDRWFRKIFGLFVVAAAEGEDAFRREAPGTAAEVCSRLSARVPESCQASSKPMLQAAAEFFEKGQQRKKAQRSLTPKAKDDLLAICFQVQQACGSNAAVPQTADEVTDLYARCVAYLDTK